MRRVTGSKKVNHIILHLDQGNKGRKCAKIRAKVRELGWAEGRNFRACCQKELWNFLETSVTICTN